MFNSPVIELPDGNRRERAAFSLLEVLVATTILAVIVFMLGAIMNSVSLSWRSASGRSETSLSARAIADYIQTDLAPALLPVNTADTHNLQFILNSAAVPSDYQNGDALFWQAPVANDTTYGDIAEVGYFVKWITGSSSRPQPILCRFFVEPASSGSASSNYQIYQRPTDWLNQDTIDAVAPGSSESNYAGLFAENVVGIWFRCFDSAGKDLGQSFNSRDAALTTGTATLPSSVQVSFVVIDSRSATRLNASLQTALASMAGTVKSEVSGKDKTVSPAEEFVERSYTNAALKSISAGLKAHTTTVFLVNAR